MRREVLLDGMGKPMMELPQGAHAFKSAMCFTPEQGLWIEMQSENAAEAKDLADIGKQRIARGARFQLNETTSKTTLKTRGLKAMWNITPVGAEMIKRGHKSSGWTYDLRAERSNKKGRIRP